MNQMQLIEKEENKTEADLKRSPTLGEYAYQMIEEQCDRIFKQEKKVLADEDPEPLHRMRVGTRRLRTALQVFQVAVDLPKAMSDKRVRSIANTLGQLRDLDVQIATIKTDYYPRLDKAEQKLINQVLESLTRQRRQSFKEVEETLNASSYEHFKTAYKNWLKQPKYKPLAELSLDALLPDLFNPLLSTLLLHEGWLIPVGQLSHSESLQLHDLRKACKRVRYQAEFFCPFYNQDFQSWVEEIKTIQEKLGSLQDSQVLFDLLSKELPSHTELPSLQTAIQQQQAQALADWDTLRCKYLEPTFRHHLHQLILEGRSPASIQVLQESKGSAV
jgi:CHAD domain-containing protein